MPFLLVAWNLVEEQPDSVEDEPETRGANGFQE